MTAMTESPSSTLDAEYPLPLAMGAQTTGSILERYGWQPSPRSKLDFPFRRYLHGEGPVDHITISLTDTPTISGWGDSSAAFAPDGPARSPMLAYRARINALRLYAEHDGYGLNSNSEFDFWRFVFSLPCLRKGGLVLMDNGNLRAVWKDKQGTHLGLQFLGGGMVQYVIFKKRRAAKLISRVAGRDTFEGLRRQIDAFDLHPLLHE